MATGAADDELTEALVGASRELVGIAVRSIAAAPVPVTVPQYRVLVLLATRGAMTVGEIADLIGVNQSNASRLCDRLQRLDLVQRQRVSEDGRAVRVSLTDQGARIVDSVTEERRREVSAVVARMPGADAQAVVSALSAFSEAAQMRDDRPSTFADA
jgi:DNA-binding MarR family transcriptional regulator